MNICYIISSLRPCGPVNQLYYILAGLDRTDFKPYIVTLSGEKSGTEIDKFRPLVREICNYRFPGSGLLSFGKRVRSFMFEKGISLVHSQGIRPDTVSAIFSGVPGIFTLRNYPYEDYILKYGYTKGLPAAAWHMGLLKKQKRVVAVSRGVARLVAQHGLQAEVITNGVDTEKYRPSVDGEKEDLRRSFGLPLGKKVFICAGAMIKRKRPGDVVEGFIRSGVSENAVLVMAGDGPLLENLKSRYGGRKNVIFAGEFREMDLLLRAADYFVSASVSEGLPNAVLEAMACGLPVFVSDIEQHREITGTGAGFGKLFPVEDVKALSAALDIYNKDEYDKKRELCRRTITEKFSAERMSQEYTKLYKRTVE
ncbi:MAG: glycosyltransferase [Candidatus Omnitrophica bacterium]|nr:glycosyltransferase [Candidatus Omnitrophota bacterium]